MKKGTVVPSQSEDVKQMLNRYSGKSEAELLGALSQMNDSERSEMHTFAKELLPMLNASQREKLAAILRQIDP